jgi:hypothetical protein
LQLNSDAIAEILCKYDLKRKFRGLCVLLEIKLILILQNATCERIFSRRTLIKTKQRCSMRNALLDILLMISLNGPDLAEGREAIFAIVGPAIQAFKAHHDRFPKRSSAGVLRRKRKLEKGDLLCELAGLEDAIYDDEVPKDADMQGMEPLEIPIAQRESDDQARLREEQELQEARAQLAAVGTFEVPISMRALPAPVDMSNKTIKMKKPQDRLKIAHRLCSGWQMGTLVQEETSKKNKGLFSVKWPEVRDGKTVVRKGMTLHELKLDRYGEDKDWVLLECVLP